MVKLSKVVWDMKTRYFAVCTAPSMSRVNSIDIKACKIVYNRKTNTLRWQTSVLISVPKGEIEVPDHIKWFVKRTKLIQIPDVKKSHVVTNTQLREIYTKLEWCDFICIQELQNELQRNRRKSPKKR